MTEDEANELGAGISSRTDDSNLYRHIGLLVCSYAPMRIPQPSL